MSRQHFSPINKTSHTRCLVLYPFLNKLFSNLMHVLICGTFLVRMMTIFKYSRLGCSGSLTTIIRVTYPKVGLLEFYLFQWKDKFFLSLIIISFCKKLSAFILVCTFEPHDLFGYFRFILGSFGPYWGSSQNI